MREADARLLSQRRWDITGVTLSTGERADAHYAHRVLEHLGRRPEQLLAWLPLRLAPGGEAPLRRSELRALACGSVRA